ncbi:MAG: polymorphic toxin type 50 domain-containing protein [Treponema sp.]
MTFDLSGMPDDVQQIIRDALEMRQAALQTAEREIVNAVQQHINDIKKGIGTHGVLSGVDTRLNAAVDEGAVHFAAELDHIIEKGLTRSAHAGLSIGAGLIAAQSGACKLVKIDRIDKDLIKQAAAIAESTLHKKRIYKDKEFILSDRIWDLSENNAEKIKEIISSGINTDCVKVANALSQYVKEGAASFIKDYPDMYKRMGGRVPKNFNYEALRLARNELSEIYWQATIEGFKDNPAVKAIKWLLSNNRPAGYHDICDTLAYTDAHGLGAGIYPVDAAPEKPHICCLCTLAPVIAKDIKRGDVANKPPENWKEIRDKIKKGNAFINMDELTEEQKNELKKRREDAYRVRLEKKLETLHNKPAQYRRAYAKCYGTTVNKHKQNWHIFGSKTVKKDGSYFKNDLETLQQIVEEKVGKGEISLTKRNLTEIIQDDRLKGYDINPKTGEIRETNKAKIHYSKTGTHVVPYTALQKEKE